MITLQRLGHAGDRFQLNPDLIVSVESTPDTVITLATSAKVVVADSPEQVRDAVRRWRVQVLSAALRDRSELIADADVAPEPLRARPHETRTPGPQPERRIVPEPIRTLERGPVLAAIGGGAR